MRAIVIDDYGKADVLRVGVVARPVPAAGEILIRVHAIGVNPADHKWRAGMFAEMAPFTFPHILGYDVAGTVEALGDGVGRFAVGDRVAASLDPFGQGGYAEFAVAREQAVAHLPNGLDFDIAAALPTAGLTGVQLIEEALDIRAGQRLLVTGATGAVGRFAVHIAKKRLAHVVAAVRPAQVADALSIGADEAISLEAGPGETAPFDAIADTVGGSQINAFCRRLGPGGKIRTVSTTPIPPDGVETTIHFFAVHADGARLESLASSAAAGALTVPIAQRLPLDQAMDAHRLVEAGGLCGKIILIP